MSSDKHLTWKTSFLLAHTLAKKIIEFYGLSFHVRYSLGWKSYTFLYVSDFMAKVQNPSVLDLRFDEVTILSLDEFMGGDREELLLCPIRVLEKYNTCICL